MAEQWMCFPPFLRDPIPDVQNVQVRLGGVSPLCDEAHALDASAYLMEPVRHVWRNRARRGLVGMAR